jgi:hypothetical protein
VRSYKKMEKNMNQKISAIDVSRVKWVIAFGVLSLAACSKTEPPAPPVATSNVVAASPAIATNAETPKIQCKKGKETRTLEVTKKASGYLLDYEKLGKMTTVSKSPVGLNQCMQEEKKIRTKLEHSGFTCT